jgi:hypothetical protein
MTTRPGPSTERILEAVQHVLIAAVSVVIAVVVVVAFLRVLSTDDTAANGDGATASTETLPEGVVTPGSTTIPEVIIVDPGTPTVAPTTLPPTSCDRQQPSADRGQMVLRIFMPCGDPSLPSNSTYIFRTVDSSTALLTNTMEQLVAGPTTEERNDGFTSFWSPDTANAINSVQLAEGAVLVNFGTPVTTLTGIDEEPARSFFLADIYTSLFQYERVNSVELRLGSDCEAFFALLGQGGCTVVDRGGWDAQLAQWRSEG